MKTKLKYNEIVAKMLGIIRNHDLVPFYNDPTAITTTKGKIIFRYRGTVMEYFIPCETI